jgi:hypothetical protein
MREGVRSPAVVGAYEPAVAHCGLSPTCSCRREISDTWGVQSQNKIDHDDYKVD